MSPPERKRPAPTDRPFRNYTNAEYSTHLYTALRRRQAASRRLTVQAMRSDPWYYEPPGVSGYEEAARHLLGHGLTPAPNSAALREMRKAGNESRSAAEVIIERWGLVA
jgi:hypothetical protein